MVRGDEESFMEYGFGVAGLNGYGKYAISSDGTACYSGDVQGRGRIYDWQNVIRNLTGTGDIVRSVL